MPDDVVIARNVTHQYRAGGRVVDALRGLSLRVPRGSWTMLVGRSGAGKSTLLGLLAGQFAWCGEGCLLLLDNPVNRLDAATRARLLFPVRQDPLTSTAPDLTVAEHLAVADSRPVDVAPPWSERIGAACFPLRQSRIGQFAPLLREHGLAEYLDRPVGELSGGERQLLVLLLARLRHVPFLLLDEALSNVDEVHARRCLEVLRDMNRAGTTLLMVTHDLRVACAHGDRLVCIAEGRALREFEAEEKKGLTSARLWELMDPVDARLQEGSAARG